MARTVNFTVTAASIRGNSRFVTVLMDLKEADVSFLTHSVTKRFKIGGDLTALGVKYTTDFDAFIAAYDSEQSAIGSNAASTLITGIGDNVVINP